jgi:butyrate kinase
MNLQTEPMILVINPGSTSTKVALFRGTDKMAEDTLLHGREELSHFRSLWEQFDFRLQAIQDFLARINIPAFALQAVVGRGGLLKPLRRGVYRVDDNMVKDARAGVQGEHVSNLGCALAREIGVLYGGEPFVVDPVSVDEFEPLARYSGHPLIPRRSLSHALNLRAAAIWAAERVNADVEENNFIVAHLGGGISIAPVKNGRIIDVNDASSDGPFSPERSGGLPLQPLVDICFSGQYSKEQVRQMIMGKGGLVAYVGTHDAREIEKRIAAGDTKAAEAYAAMAYQIGKEIGAMAAVLQGNVKAVVLTGGLVFSKRLVELISSYISFISPVITLPGELELEAMALGALRALRGKEKVLEYQTAPVIP